MQKILLLFMMTAGWILKVYAQESPEDKRLLDSLLKNDAMLKMIDQLTKPKSFVRINIGAGNKLNGDQNKYIESFQGNSPFVIIPSLEYDHKSGFGIAATGFLYNENNKSDFYQYTLSPSYSYKNGKVADMFVSYIHYFQQNVYSSNASPVQDGFYANILFKKPWLRPGLSSGYSWGAYHEVVRIDTSIAILGTRYVINYIDSVFIKLRSFSLTASIEHSFGFYNIFSIKDGLLITPQLSLFSGINSYNISHTSSLENFLSFTKLKLKRVRHFLSQDKNNNKFQLQSAGFDLDVNYTIGKFYTEPEVYIDYYLPKTNDNRFTVIYNFSIGITF